MKDDTELLESLMKSKKNKDNWYADELLELVTHIQEHANNKDIDLENLEDIYNINYNVVICGKEIKPRGMDKKSVTILVSDDRAMEDAVGSNIYWIIDLKSLICVEHTKPVMEDRSLKKVEVEINKIEKFVEYKKHIEIFEYKGTERREFLNTKETLDYLFDDFPN